MNATKPILDSLAQAVRAERDAVRDAAAARTAMYEAESRKASAEASVKAAKCAAYDLARAIVRATESDAPPFAPDERGSDLYSRVTFAHARIGLREKTRGGPSRWVAYGWVTYKGSDNRTAFDFDPGRGTSDVDALAAQRVAAERQALHFLREHTARAFLTRNRIDPDSLGPIADYLEATPDPTPDHHGGKLTYLPRWRITLRGSEPFTITDGYGISAWDVAQTRGEAYPGSWASEPGGQGEASAAPFGDDRVPQSVRDFMERHAADVLAWWMEQNR